MAQRTRPHLPQVRPDGLQLDEHRTRQERYWRIQRVAWWSFGAIMMLAALGLTGGGGAFHMRTVAFPTATVEVPRVTRWQGSDGMTITFHDAAPRHEIRITQPFFDRFSIERIQPEPFRTMLLTGAQSMVFPSAGDPPHHVGIDLRAGGFGWTAFYITIGDRTRRVSLIVLP